MPDPATRSLKELDTRTSPGSPIAARRAAMCAAHGEPGPDDFPFAGVQAHANSGLRALLTRWPMLVHPGGELC